MTVELNLSLYCIAYMWQCLIFLTGFRARYGSENVVVSDIVKPPPNVYEEGMLVK